MDPVTVAQVAAMIGGTPGSGCDPGSVVTGATIDSRTAGPGDLFFALPGSRAHASRYGADAVRRGAVCIVTDPVAAAQSADHLPVVVVPDTVQAMSDLGAWCRRQTDALVVAVTGSVGKTTTRRLIAAVLGSEYQGIQSPKNYNNHLGLPLSLMQMQANTEYAVLELGASAVGEIAALARLAQPEMAVVTRVAPAHLTGFGSLDAIQRAKGELVEAIPAQGTVFLNADDPGVRSMACRTAGQVVLFGESDDAEVRLSDIETRDARVTFCVNGFRYEMGLPGRHHALCGAAAVAVGLHVGLRPERIAEGLAACPPEAGRGARVLDAPWVVLDDTYNASPASLRAAVDVLDSWQRCHHRLLVLGDMLELGELAGALHFEAGQCIGRSRIDHVLLLGQHATDAAQGVLSIRGRSGQSSVSIFQDLDVLLAMLDCVASPGDVILVKGSRGMQMERVVERLQQAAKDRNQPCQAA